MSEYRRFVSYIYAYEDGQKTANAGFAKIEIRGETATIELHIRGAKLSVPSMEFYLYIAEEPYAAGIKLGDVPFTNGCTDWKFTVNQNILQDTKYSINDANGIILNLDETFSYISQWDEKKISFSNFRLLNQKNNDDFSQSEITNVDKIDNDSQQQKSMHSTELAETINHAPAGISQSDHRSDDKDDNNDNEHIVPQPETEHHHSDTKWDIFFDEHETIHPFSDENISCIQIELKELRQLPSLDPHLTNNSFLLRSFFTYHHLMIGRIRAGKSDKYFLGVPGIRYQQEHIMAAIFGCMDFIPEKENMTAPTPFGYWILPITDKETETTKY